MMKNTIRAALCLTLLFTLTGCGMFDFADSRFS